jgi:hypothetical protein
MESKMIVGFDNKPFCVVALNIVEGSRKQIFEVGFDSQPEAEKLFDILGESNKYDIVQFWFYQDGKPVYRQW